MQVWRVGFQRVDGQVSYLGVSIHEMSDESFKQFRWDRPNQVDVPEQGLVLYFFATELSCNHFLNGYSVHRDLDKILDKMEHDTPIAREIRESIEIP